MQFGSERDAETLRGLQKQKLGNVSRSQEKQPVFFVQEPELKMQEQEQRHPHEVLVSLSFSCKPAGMHTTLPNKNR